MWLSFDALDVLFFRDGRPFDAGDAHTARSIFPPLPGTMLGGTRALLLEERFGGTQADGASISGYLRWLRGQPRDLDTTAAGGHPRYQDARQELGVAEQPGSMLRLTGPFVSGGDDKVLVVAPRDLMEREDSRDLVVLSPLIGAGATGLLPGARWSPGPPIAVAGSAQLPLSLPLVTTAVELEELKGAGWIDLDALRAYLTGAGSLSKREPPVLHERRAGIALSERRTARERHFYEIDLVRPRTPGGRTRLLTRITPDPVGVAWRLPLGGEGKVALVEQADTSKPAQEMEDVLDPAGITAQEASGAAARTGWIRLVLLQPAIFHKGWLPDAVSANGQLEVGEHTFHLRSAAVGKPVAVSGWDLLAGEPKPLRRAVPAGSVYFFQIAVDDEQGRQKAAAAFWDTFHGKTALLDARMPWGPAGYGLAVAGVCTPEER
jgi:CRISPR-associated protein Cmr3